MRRALLIRFVVITALLLLVAPVSLPTAHATATFVYTGELSGESHPWDDYVLGIVGGTLVVIDEECTPASLLDPSISVSGPNGFNAKDDDSGMLECEQGDSSHLEFIAPVTGDYTIRASSYEILFDNDPTDENADGYYRLTITFEPVVGCDMQLDLSGAVVGTFVADAPVYAEPGTLTAPLITIPAGKSYWVRGLDESEQYYQIYLQCSSVWVPASAVGPNYDSVWNGTPLPITVISHK